MLGSSIRLSCFLNIRDYSQMYQDLILCCYQYIEYMADEDTGHQELLFIDY